MNAPTAPEDPSAATDAGGATPPAALERELAELFVSSLNLEIDATQIDPQAPLYGEGLGLDSIDILELALVISRRYGVDLRADDENNARIFASLRSLAQHVHANRSK